MTDEGRCSVEGRVGRITLNRPGALHALTTAMCAAMIEALAGWRGADAVEAVIIDHSGERGFCAGGDIRMLADSGAGDGAKAREFFHTEYRLNHLLFTYPKPVVAFMDGVTMGGGVGISMPARFRIATERTTFAMPETGIGLFPDVGVGWTFAQLPDEIGMYLALTGRSLERADAYGRGLGTHCLPAGQFTEVCAGIRDADPVAVDAARTAGAVGVHARRNRERVRASERLQSIPRCAPNGPRTGRRGSRA